MKTPDSGWQQLQRERYHLEAEYRFPPPAHVQTLAGVLPGVLKDMGLESRSRIAELSPRWKDIVGAANAKHSRPARWEAGVLTVYVDHNVWLAELKRFASKAILKRIREAYGPDSIRDLVFQIDPGEEST